MTTTIHFVRHGEVHNPDDVFYARLPRFRLSEKGIRQAQAGGQHFRAQPIAAIYHSPMLRARQTALHIGQVLGLPLRQTALLNEIHTPHQGRPTAEMTAIDWNIYLNLPPGYETQADLMARLQRFAHQACRRHPGAEVIAVSHGDVVIHAQMWARGLPVTHEGRKSVQPYPTHVSITTLHFERAGQGPSGWDFRVPHQIPS
jgi:broad specificity phosphatase PhoE